VRPALQMVEENPTRAPTPRIHWLSVLILLDTRLPFMRG
jgi:hypothetical protein